MLWYSKNNVFDNEPNVFSNSFVSSIAKIESIPYCSNAASGSICSHPSFNTFEHSFRK